MSIALVVQKSIKTHAMQSFDRSEAEKYVTESHKLLHEFSKEEESKK